MPEIRLEFHKKGVTVIADEEPVLHTTAAVLRQANIRSGDNLSQDELDRVILFCKEQAARRKAVNLLSRQGMSKKSLTRKLGGDEVAGVVADQMERAGYINDLEYARGRAELLINRRLHSPVHAEYELAAEGIARDIARQAVEETECDLRENIRRLLESRYRSKINQPDGLKKTVLALRRAGYCMGDIRAVLGEDYDIECEDVLPTWESE